MVALDLCCRASRRAAANSYRPMVGQLLKRSSLAEQVIAQVRELISGGTYHLGDKLPTEAELSTMFGVGRSTIREAMRVLANRGLVDIKHGEGTFVAAQSIHESFEERLGRAKLDTIYEARLFLELPLAELAARRREGKDISAMQKALRIRAKAIKSSDVEIYVKADFDFHLAIAAAAKNKALYDIYSSFVETIQPLIKTSVTPEYLRNEHDRLHADLSDAIAAGDVSKTRKLVNEHLTKSLSGIRREVR
jgi:GntR family transcriptional repressor for pyruvate dehydrogenase complex